jgi:Uma2 family endonuclease
MGEGDVRRELINGELVVREPVGRMHGRLTGRLSRWLVEHVERQGLDGEVLVGDVGFILSLPYDPERVRGPDVAYVSRDRLPADHPPEKFVRGAPDLAVEILSPSDDPVDVQQKVRDWLDGGGRLVWVIAPRAKLVTAYRADGSAHLLREHEALEGEEVLPGLSIPLSDLFAD